jgi:predicted metal-binding membrane protein
VRNPSPVAALPRRDRVVIACCIVGATALAWAYLVRLSRQMSAPADAMTIMASMAMSSNAPVGVADLFMTWVMWSVMMVGMMSASAAPVFLLFAATQARRDQHVGRAVVTVFGLGYLAIWIGFSGGAALAQSALHQAALLSPAMTIVSARLSGAILIGAGVYQLTPAKSACLRHCQSPLGFLMSNWSDGAKGAARMGLRHGLYCLGCCWAAMGVLFVVGVMNLAWVGLLTAFILLERFGRAGILAARVGGIAMVVAGAWMSFQS